MKEYGCRDDLVLATKYSLPKPSTSTLSGMAHLPVNKSGNHRKAMFESVEASLRRLQTHYVDLLYVHFWDYTVDPESVMRSMDDLIRLGKIHHVAFSDVPAYVVAEGHMAARLRGWSPVVALQYRYNIIDRSVERDIALLARDRHIGVVPWGALHQGVLTGKYKREDVALEQVDSMRGKASYGELWKSGSLTPHNFDVAEAVAKMAGEIGHSPSQIAINWLLNKPFVTSPIVGARTAKQLEDNLGALDFRLTPEQMDYLDHLSPLDAGFPINWTGTDRFSCQWIAPAGKVV